MAHLSRCTPARYALGTLVAFVILTGAIVTSAHAAAPPSQRPAPAIELARAAAGRPEVLAPRRYWHQALPGAHGAIVGGSSAAQGEWPFMAFVVYFDSAGNPVFSCSGTVISPEVVLTAGHCAVDETTGAILDPAGYVVVTGAADWTDATHRQLSQVTSVQTAPGYNPSLGTFDAAVLVLQTATTAPAMRLATVADQGLESGGTGAVIAGWGLESQGGLVPDVLQWAPTVVQDPTYCSQFPGLSDQYDPSVELCAVDGITQDDATCNGDSGGPLLAQDASGLVEIGVTDFGPADCDTYTADYFATTRLLSSWADGVIAANAPAPEPTPAPTPTPSPPAPAPAPPPAAHPPRVLPSMTRAAARLYATKTVAGLLKSVWSRGHGRQISCSRSNASKFACKAMVRFGASDYWGTVSVFYVFGQAGKLFWSDHYTLHWANDRCYFHTRHPARCTVHTRQGTW